MRNETPVTFPLYPPQRASNCDEMFMQQRSQFADSLKDLNNLRKQLYSAAEYFEINYDKDDHKQFVVETSKDYLMKALISTVDHLGSAADKLGQFLDAKTNEFSETKIRFSCIEQRLKVYQGFNDLNGRSQQSLIIETPKHHKRYIGTGKEILHGGKSKSMYRNCISFPGYELHQPKQDTVFQAAVLKPSQILSRKGPSKQRLIESSPKCITFSFTRIEATKEAGKRSISPLRFPIKRSGSNGNRSSSPSSMSNKQRCPSEPQRAISMPVKPEMTRGREIEQYAKKSKHLFKALLGIHGSRKETLPNRYIDNRL